MGHGIEVIRGDLIELALQGRFDTIVHGYNCFCTMGAGIAAQIKTRFLAAFEADRQTKRGDRDKIDTYTSATICNEDYTSNHTFEVVNAYTQYRYGRGVQVDYDAVAIIFDRIARDYTGCRIGYPMIGAGLAGGDWNRLSSIITTRLEGLDHTLVIYSKVAK